MKNKRFTIFRVFARLVAKANFGGNTPLKNPNFKILTPLLLLMVQSIIFYIYNQVWDQKVQKYGFTAPKTRFFGENRDFPQTTFFQTKHHSVPFFSTIFGLVLRNLAKC